MGATSLLILLCPCCADTGPGGMPEILVKAFQQRTNYQTAYFKFKRITNRPHVSRQVENFEARYSGDSVYLIDEGDDDGIRLKQPLTLEPLLGVSSACLPERIVVDRERDEWWVYHGGLNHLALSSEASRPVLSDVRSFGLYAKDIPDKTPVDMLQVLYDSEEYTRWQLTEEEGGVVVVSCRVLPESGEYKGHLECEWRIDPAKDFAIIQVMETVVSKEGKRALANRVDSQYVCRKGKWWPGKSEWTKPQSGYSCCIEYEQVEFDRPDHPQKIGPDLLGLPVGIVVYAPEFDDCGRYLGDGVMVDEADWGSINDQYDLGPLRAFWAKNRAMGDGDFPAWWQEEEFGLNGLEYTPDLWEAYVRRWMLKHTSTEHHHVPIPLSEQQINAAWAVLKDCRKIAMPFLMSSKQEHSAVEPALKPPETMHPSVGNNVKRTKSTTRTATEPRSGNALTERQRDDERRQRQLARLFAELKQRLEDLLRAPQRSEAATSRPMSAMARDSHVGG